MGGEILPQTALSGQLVFSDVAWRVLAQDAVMAAEHGLSGVVLSNHGLWRSTRGA
jgi:copper homeostasis protein CutC